jgi:dTDP-4-amino-4,6-dideoxy-D-galactose acyltransferase
MQAESIGEYLEWDSQFFGRRIARARVHCLTEETAFELRSWCELNWIDCLYFLADSSDAKTVKLAETSDFSFVDIRLTLQHSLNSHLTSNCAQLRVRDARDADIPALRNIARDCHRDSRFYYDEHFPRSLCDALYEVWIEKSCRGWARKVFVADDEGMVAGYITCHLPGSEAGQIGLVGVREKAHGKGLGKELVGRAVRWFAEQGVKDVSVVTQGRNVRAQRLYQRAGFVTGSLELWYHRWFARAEWKG